jgi:iron complex transport system substrate-binding protein
MGYQWRMRWIALLLLLTVPASTAPVLADAPRRIVSFNLCADQLVLALADPEQIAGLSPYAADASTSVMTEQARAYPRLQWQAESTIALGPDLVLIGDSDRPVTKHILRSQGLQLHEITLIADLDTARRQVREVAAVLGHPQRGEKLIAGIEAARARLHAAPKPPFTTALLVNRGGYTAGERSLAAALLMEAGLKPPDGAPPGYGGYVQLEKLLVLHPDVIVLNNEPRDAADQGSYNLTHPALNVLYPPERRIILPARYTLCGGPALIAALDYLTELLTRLAQSPTMRTN